jgi:two-component system, sensor histidine kinase
LTDHTLERKILGEQIALLHKQAPSVFFGTLISTGALVWLLWDEPVERPHLLAWLSLVSVVIAMRWFGLLRYRADPDRVGRGAYWAWWFTAGAALSGLCMGYLGWSFFQPTLLFLFPIGLIMGVMVALSVPSVGVFFPAHAVFNLLSMTPFMLRNFLEEGRLFFGQSFALLFMMISCLLFAYRQQATIRHSVRLRFENLDLLERARSESERALKAQQQAQEANAAKSRFLAAASHDLRQPLQAMSIFVHILADRAKNKDIPDATLLGNIQASCEGLENLMDSLLDLSRAEIGAVVPDIRDIRLQPVLQKLRREFAEQARAKGLRLRVANTRQTVKTDGALLMRILRNLISNAVRYTEHGGILVGCRRSGDLLRIEVRDSGVGISATQREEIFREFYQIGNPERDRRKGLGLGLAIVDGLARQLGHSINVQSEPDRGSTFSIELPPGKADTGERVTETNFTDHLRGQLIVVIDDEPMIRDAMSRLLTSWYCKVISGETADEVLDQLGNDVPAAILADWRLREGRFGSLEALRIHAQFHRPIPTVLITGDTAPEVGLDSGFSVIRKPIQGFRLRAQLDALLAPFPSQIKQNTTP